MKNTPSRRGGAQKAERQCHRERHGRPAVKKRNLHAAAKYTPLHRTGAIFLAGCQLRIFISGCIPAFHRMGAL